MPAPESVVDKTPKLFIVLSNIWIILSHAIKEMVGILMVRMGKRTITFPLLFITTGLFMHDI